MGDLQVSAAETHAEIGRHYHSRGAFCSSAVNNCLVLPCSEPEALPFCALAYALIGIISTVLVALPPIARALLAITA